jgi:hypothetical protein
MERATYVDIARCVALTQLLEQDGFVNLVELDSRLGGWWGLVEHQREGAEQCRECVCVCGGTGREAEADENRAVRPIEPQGQRRSP